MDILDKLNSENGTDYLAEAIEEIIRLREDNAHVRSIAINAEKYGYEMGKDYAIKNLAMVKMNAKEALKPFASYKTPDGIPNSPNPNFLRMDDRHPVLFTTLGADEVAINIGNFRKAKEIYDSL